MNTSQISKELQRIVAALTELTGLPSQWSGIVELVPEADFNGKNASLVIFRLMPTLHNRKCAGQR